MEFFPQCLDFLFLVFNCWDGQLGVDEFKVDRVSITLADGLSAIRASRYVLQRWKELICAAFTKSVPCQIVNIINNKKQLLELCRWR